MVSELGLFDDLESDHRQIEMIYRALILECEKSKCDDSVCRGLLQNLISAIKAHAWAEENVLYEYFFSVGHGDVRHWAIEGEVEHHMIDNLLEEMRSRSTVDEIFHGQMNVLGNVLQTHIRKEESKIFPEAKLLMTGDSLKFMESQYRDKKDEVRSDGEAIGTDMEMANKFSPFSIFGRIL